MSVSEMLFDERHCPQRNVRASSSEPNPPSSKIHTTARTPTLIFPPNQEQDNNAPEALAKAALASFPTLVDPGRQVLRIRRTQARGGSNSTAVGNSPPPVVLVVVVDGRATTAVEADDATAGAEASPPPSSSPMPCLPNTG